MLNKIRKNAVLLLLIFSTVSLFSSSSCIAQTPPVLIFTPVISSGLSAKSLDIVNAGDGTNRIFIVGLEGTVRIISGGTILPVPFLDISGDSIPNTTGERGLLSLVFHPGYDGVSNRYFFIYYCVPSGVRITRFQTAVGNPDITDETTGTVLLTIDEPVGGHNGAKLHFGPDGNLYFATGDGGGSNDPTNEAQNGNSLLGKMIRINVDNFTTPPYYSIPIDNPYVSDPLVRDEVFAIGFRNPWRWSFDRLNNDVWIADVGEGAREEINYRTLATSGGINYGWRCYEGTEPNNTTGCLPQSSYISPIFEYEHNSSTGGFSVTGGYVYRGSEFGAMYGYYICSDFISGNAWLIKPNGSGGWNVSQQNYVLGGNLPKFITSFGEDENGVLYAVSYSGTFFKVVTSSVLPATLLQFTAKAFTGFNELQWKTVNEHNLSLFEIEYSSDGVNYVSAGKVNAVNSPSENNYRFQHFIAGFNKLFYRLNIKDKDSRSSLSDVVQIDNKETRTIRIYPSLITNNRLNIISAKPVEQVIIFSTEGKKVFQDKVNNLTGTISISIPYLLNGLYIVQVKWKDGYVNGKILLQQK